MTPSDLDAWVTSSGTCSATRGNRVTRREQRVLAYVNRLRDQLGLKPLKRLPEGEPEERMKCPIARALAVGGLAADVGPELICVFAQTGRALLEVEPPKYVADWINAFDNGRFPHLELGS